MNEKDLRAIIEQVLSELGTSAANTPAAAQAVAPRYHSNGPQLGGGVLPQTRNLAALQSKEGTLLRQHARQVRLSTGGGSGDVPE